MEIDKIQEAYEKMLNEKPGDKFKKELKRVKLLMKVKEKELNQANKNVEELEKELEDLGDMEFTLNRKAKN